MQFGALTELTNRDGSKRLVGELALHVDVPWRFRHHSKILIGNRDLYWYPNGESYDFDKGGDSRFHVFANEYAAKMAAKEWSVASIADDNTGSFTLNFTGDLIFDAMPNVAHSSPGFEFWRLFSPVEDGKHLVSQTDA